MARTLVPAHHSVVCDMCQQTAQPQGIVAALRIDVVDYTHKASRTDNYDLCNACYHKLQRLLGGEV